jgi:alginate O-acetyltransferase complex protein AlgI
MIFTSKIFVIFLVILLGAYKTLSNNYRGYLLLIGSLIFYASWSLPFTTLLLGYSFIIFLFGWITYKLKNLRLFPLLILISLFPLLFYKYRYFILDNINYLLSANFSIAESIFLPLGISFFTFQGISYLIDIKNKLIKPEKNFLIILLFISFFPQLIAGPIEKAKNLIPQLKKLFTFAEINISKSEIEFAVFLIVLGFFKKIVIADNIGLISDFLFSKSDQLNFITASILMFSFSFQIYFDFSAYSQIARGVAKLFGIDLMINFNLPYLSRNISEFWRKWHISLSNWFRDYVYIPLGGNRSGSLVQFRNLIIVFFLCGLWHGANWLFIIWGFFHGFLYLIYYSYSFFIKKIGLQLTSNFIYKYTSVLITFIAVSIGWLIFRSPDIETLSQILVSFLNITKNISILSDLFIVNGRNNYLFFYILFIILLYFVIAILEPLISPKYRKKVVSYAYIPLAIITNY